jgi:hypothetical protein
MKVRGTYEVSEQHRGVLANQAKKGLAATLLVLVPYLLCTALLQSQTGTPTALVLDAVAVMALLLVIHSYSRGQMGLRLQFARESFQAGNWSETFALLQPLASGCLLNLRSRFDGTGEGYWLLASAAAQLDEREAEEYCLRFLVRYRKGEWAERAENLLKKRRQG